MNASFSFIGSARLHLISLTSTRVPDLSKSMPPFNVIFNDLSESLKKAPRHAFYYVMTKSFNYKDGRWRCAQSVRTIRRNFKFFFAPVFLPAPVSYIFGSVLDNEHKHHMLRAVLFAIDFWTKSVLALNKKLKVNWKFQFFTRHTHSRIPSI